MIEHVNNYNGNTILHEKCLPISICMQHLELPFLSIYLCHGLK